MQVLAPLRPEDQCHYWDCSLTLTPFCTSDHELLSELGEESAAAIVIVDGTTTEARAKLVSLKCLQGKLLNHQARYGFPMLPPAVLETPPWFQPAVFNLDLFPMEASREWVFTAPVFPGSRIGQYWQHYDTRNFAGHRRTRWNWYKRAPHHHTGTFKLSLFAVPGSPIAVYWLLYKPVIPGQKGSPVEVEVPAETDTPQEKEEPPSGSQLKKLEPVRGPRQPILGTASNPIQVSIKSSQVMT